MELSSKPYFDIDGNPCIEQSVIVVADILGYSHKIQKACGEGKQKDLLLKIHSTLGKALKNVTDLSKLKYCTKPYSDNLIIGYPFIGTGKGAWEFPQACLCIGQFQREMAVDNLIVRGGIAVGPIHVSEKLIFGKILEELKKAEALANYPRVVLLDSAMKFLDERHDIKNHDSLKDILWDDDCDGAKFINYLYPLGTGNNDRRKAEIKCHKKLIETNLEIYKSNSRVLQKYKWLAKYHNRFCHESDDYGDESYMICDDLWLG